MSVLPFQKVVASDIAAVNALIIEQLHSNVPMVENIGHYIVDAGGKRLRPLLVLLVARSLLCSGNNHVNMAVIIEFIHTATLLHDDVVDLSQLRRGRPTANAQWGNAPSVLVGDFLYSRAFQMMVSIGNMEIMHTMSDATNVIAEGEVLQLVNAGNPDTTEEQYLDVIRRKTATLFEAATKTGALIAGADAKTVQAMARFGHHLGMAFQLIDDVLDYSGNPDELGKNIGDDIAEGKPTLPLIYTIRNGTGTAAAFVRNAILEKSNKNLAEIVDILATNGALDYARAKAGAEAAMAQEYLQVLPDTQFLSAMEQLAQFSVNRQS